jgi:NhaP-type Na+/H+ or K+/H+ antiporter
VLTLAALFVLTALLEAVIVTWTLSLVERRKVTASLSSALITFSNLAFAFVTLESENKWVGAAVVACGCAVGTFLTLYIMEKRREREGNWLKVYRTKR